MGDVHTYSIGGVHQIMTAIRLMSGELSHLVGEVVHGSRVHIPCRINGVGRSVPMVMTCHCSSLFFIPFAIIAQAEEILLVALMTLGGDVALNATQLTGLLSTTTGTTSHRPGSASDGRRGGAGLRG